MVIWARCWYRPGMALSMFVTLNGTIMSGGRIPFAVARDGYFFKALAEVHPRFHTPSLALIVQCVMATALQLGGGSFRDFLELAIFSEWLFYMIAASTIFVFRHPRAEHATSLQHMGISCGSGAIRRRRSRAALFHVR